MHPSFNPRFWLSSTVRRLNDEHLWHLTEHQIEEYASALVPGVRPDDSEQIAATMVLNYHHEHRRVQALRDAQDGSHALAWEEHMRSIEQIVRAKFHYHSLTGAIDIYDLMQIACIEIIRSLSSFHYRSKLNTWAYTIVTNTIKRQIREYRAKKRQGDQLAISYGHPLAAGQLVCSAIDERAPAPESSADGSALARLVADVLYCHDPRLRTIFLRWAIDDTSVEEIGSQLGLSPSRTRSLLAEARRYLQQLPSICAWLDLDPDIAA